ncbi:hypothetical protein TNCV_3283521 [Trichonephila clavipes]|nr:hypothetical protein TNCV_3283521 [Trichonephila clavipes]
MGYAQETNCSPFAPTKLRYRIEESSPRSLEPFEPTTHSSSHSKHGPTGPVPWLRLLGGASSRSRLIQKKILIRIISKGHRWGQQLSRDPEPTLSRGRRASRNLKTSLRRAVGSQVVRASVAIPEDLGSMPDATKCPPSTHGFHALIVEIGGVAIYRPFGNLSELIRAVTCMVLKANDRRTSSPVILKMVYIDPQGSMTTSKGSTSAKN